MKLHFKSSARAFWFNSAIYAAHKPRTDFVGQRTMSAFMAHLRYWLEHPIK